MTSPFHRRRQQETERLIVLHDNDGCERLHGRDDAAPRTKASLRFAFTRRDCEVWSRNDGKEWEEM